MNQTQRVKAHKVHAMKERGAPTYHVKNMVARQSTGDPSGNPPTDGET